MPGLTREETDAFVARRAERLSTMTRGQAIAALDAYHAAARACRGLYRRPEKEREPLSRALALARAALDEAVRVEWKDEAAS